MDEDLIETLVKLVLTTGEMVLEGEKLEELRGAAMSARRYLLERLQTNREYAGITYWYHPESDSAVMAFGPFEADHAALQGCDQIDRERYLQIDTEDLI